MESVLQHSPVGWWLNYKADQWCGPFKTPEEAEEAAKVIVPLSYPEYHLLQVAPWETRTVKNAMFPSDREPCPECKGTGFIAGRCCRKCEGSMSLPRRSKG